MPRGRGTVAYQVSSRPLGLRRYTVRYGNAGRCWLTGLGFLMPVSRTPTFCSGRQLLRVIGMRAGFRGEMREAPGVKNRHHVQARKHHGRQHEGPAAVAESCWPAH